MSKAEQKRKELNERAKNSGETVDAAGGTRGDNGLLLEAQDGSSGHGGETRKDQICTDGFQTIGRKGGHTITDKSRGEKAHEEGFPIGDEITFRRLP